MRISKLLLSLLLLAAVAPSQRHGGPPPPPPKRGSFAEWRVQDFTRRFELSDSQRDQALGIFREADKEAQPLEVKLEQANRALREATRRNASHSEIDQLAATVGTLTGQLAAINAKAETAFYNTLSSKQREAIPRGPRGFKGPPPPRE